jgi:hypothetical protein
VELDELVVLQGRPARSTMPLPSPVQVCADVQEKYARP